jgi:hypothetical protein
MKQAEQKMTTDGKSYSSPSWYMLMLRAENAFVWAISVEEPILDMTLSRSPGKSETIPIIWKETH